MTTQYRIAGARDGKNFDIAGARDGRSFDIAGSDADVANQLQQQSSSTSSYSPSSTRTYTSTSSNTGSNMAFIGQLDPRPRTPIPSIGQWNLQPKEYTDYAIGGQTIIKPGTPPPIQYRSDGATSFDGGATFSGGSSSSSSSSGGSSLGFGSSSLQNVFTDLGNIAETKAQNDQRRFREDLPFQSRIYQDFDTEAAKRTEGIDTRAREQNSNLTKDRMRLQSQQNMAEEKNRGQVQVSTTGQTRDADLKRALSVLPRK